MAGRIVKVTERHRDNARDITTARKAATAANVEVFELVNVMRTSVGGRQDDLPVVPAAEDGGASAAMDAGGTEEAGVDTTAPSPSVATDTSPSMGEINQPDTLRHMHEVPPPTEGLPEDAFRGFVPAFGRDWDFAGRDEQQPPPGDWRTWLIMGGRGSGKTRAGAEWVHWMASAGKRSDLRIALVAETLGDAREVMIDGVSGICRIARKDRPQFEVSRRRLVWPNGAVAQIFSSEDPEALRGPQFHYAWCDELASGNIRKTHSTCCSSVCGWATTRGSW